MIEPVFSFIDAYIKIVLPNSEFQFIDIATFWK